MSFSEGESLILYRSEAAPFDLSEGAVLSAETYRHLKTEIVGKRARKRALLLLQQQDYSERKLLEKLVRGGYPPSVAEEAVDYVRSYHYLDDERMARVYIRNHQESLSRGILLRKLIEKGISREEAEKCLEEEYAGDERAQIRLLLEKKDFSKKKDDRKEKMRIFAFLTRRGFSTSDIMREMDHF